PHFAQNLPREFIARDRPQERPRALPPLDYAVPLEVAQPPPQRRPRNAQPVALAALVREPRPGRPRAAADFVEERREQFDVAWAADPHWSIEDTKLVSSINQFQWSENKTTVGGWPTVAELLVTRNPSPSLSPCVQGRGEKRCLTPSATPLRNPPASRS